MSTARPKLSRPLAGLLVMVFFVGLTLAFFNPLIRGFTASVVPGHQTAVYPWRGLPSNGLSPDYPQSDQADLSYPWQTFATRSLAQNSFPFWDPHSYGGGYPFFANGQSALLYPPRFLTAVLLSPGTAHEVFIFLHVFLAGIVMYGLMREFGVGVSGSVLAAVSWMFGGFNMAWLHLEVVTPMSVFLPLTIWAVTRAFRIRSHSSTIVAGLALGGTLIAGHLILLGLVYLVAISYAAALAGARSWAALRGRGWRPAVGEWLPLGAITAISLGFAMVVLVPTASVLQDSQRDPFTYAELTRSFLAPLRTFLYSFTPPPLPITEERMHEMAFVGTATGVFAVVGILVRRRGVGLARVLLVASIAIAVGTPATWFAYRFIPGFAVFRPYSRLVVFSSFAVAVLGGFGIDALLRARRLRAVTTGARAGPRAAVVALSALAVGGTAVQLASYGRSVNPPFVPRQEASMFPATPLIEAVSAEVRRPGQWPGRILPVRAVAPGSPPPQPILFAAEALVFGFDSAGGYDSVVPRRVTALVRILQGKDPELVLRKGLPSAYAPTFLSSSTRFDLAPRLGITTLVSTPGATLEHLPTATGSLPPTELVHDDAGGRVLRLVGATAAPYVVHADDVVVNGGQALRRFIDPAFDHRRAVVLEARDLRNSGEERLKGGGGRGEVLTATRGLNSASVVATTTSPGWLVFTDSWSPGWSATVNGKRTEVVRANYAKRAVKLPAGRSVVELRYRPPGLALGTAGTSVTLLACGAVAALDLRRNRRSRREEELPAGEARI